MFLNDLFLSLSLFPSYLYTHLYIPIIEHVQAAAMVLGS